MPRKPRISFKKTPLQYATPRDYKIPEDVLGTIIQKPRRKKTSSYQLTLPENFEITPEFAHAFDLMENTREHLFITGRAGTGKSTLLQYFRSKTKKNYVVLAPTGVAAVHIGGSTIHSFFGFPPRFVRKNDIFVMPKKSKVFESLNTVIIDEVSMVRADVMEAIDHALRINRRIYDTPFGGVQMILIGDLYQLPPVVESELQAHFSESFATSYFFSAPALSSIALGKIDLQKIFRQTDPEFIRILNNARNARISPRDLAILNQRFDPDVPVEQGAITITLTSTNERAWQINSMHLASLPGREYLFEGTSTGKFEESSFPADAMLCLKEGAQVMMVRNDIQKRWVNGSLGTIHRLSENLIEVAIDGRIHPVEQITWEKIDYQYDPELQRIEPVVVGTFTQYPMKLAWAITIHKSQGKTFDRVIIDFGRGAFTTGQAYVALSRCRTFEGIYLARPVRMSDIMLDRRVAMFDANEGND